MKIHHRFGDLLNNTDGMQIIAENFISLLPPDLVTSQEQTKNVFTDKWDQYNYGTPEFKKMVAHQKNWYLELYGFNNESELAEYLRKCSIILDAGAGTCYKAAWFAELSPNTLVVAADISGSLNQATRNYSSLENILFVRCDIGSMPFFNNTLPCSNPFLWSNSSYNFTDFLYELKSQFCDEAKSVFIQQNDLITNITQSHATGSSNWGD